MSARKKDQTASAGARGTAEAGAQPELTNRESALLEELEGLLANPRAVEIMGCDWLHDGTLPMPSIELIQYFSLRLLTGYWVRIEAATHDRFALFSFLLEHLRNEPRNERIKSIPRTLRRLDCFHYLHLGKMGVADPHVHEWLPIVAAFLYPERPQDDGRAGFVAAGERALARGLLETMTLRAVFTRDHKRLQSLSNAVKIMLGGEAPKPTTKNRIKGEILRCLPYLVEKLGRMPSRAEMELFIRDLAQFTGRKEFPDIPNDWSDAFRELCYQAPPRAIRMDRDKITGLAREAAGMAT